MLSDVFPMTVKKSKTTDLYIGRCEALDLVSQGRTEAEAMVSIEDAVRLYLKHCALRGIAARATVQALARQAWVVGQFEIMRDRSRIGHSFGPCRS